MIPSFLRPLLRRLRARFLLPVTHELAGLRAGLELLTEHPQIVARGWQEGALASPAVSAIMPTWNRGFVIGEAIRSVQNQSFKDWELLIVDDGSTDNTAEAVQPFLADSRIRYLKQDHHGQCAARNHALRLAKGELIAYLDSDNLWYPDFLAAMVNGFVSDRSLDCA